MRQAARAAAVLGWVLIAGCGAPSPHARARLVSERDAFVPGDTLALGVSFTIKPGWHLYGNTFNDSGYPIQVVPHLPPGYRALPMQWPTPERLVSPGNILDHVYADRVTLILPVVAPAEAPPGGTVTVRAGLQWLVCRDICLPESAEVSLSLPVRPAAAPDPGAAPLFAETRARLPHPFSSEIRASRRGTMVVLEVSGAHALTFVPGSDCARLAHPIQEGAAEGDRLEFTLAGADTSGASVIGVLEVERPDGTSSFYNVDLAPGEGS